MGWGGGVHVLRTRTHVLASMFDVTEQVGLGWGGVGWFTFLEHAHMFLHSCLMQYVHRWQWSRSCDIDLFTSLDQACKKLHR